jgi:hypothetical protein
MVFALSSPGGRPFGKLRSGGGAVTAMLAFRAKTGSVAVAGGYSGGRMKRIAAVMALLLCGPLLAAPPAKRRPPAPAAKPADQPKGEAVTFFGNTDDGDYYLVDSTLQKVGDNGRVVVVLTDFKKPQTTERGKSALSEAVQWSIRCDSRKLAFGHVIDFAGAMGAGDMVDELAPGYTPGDEDLHPAQDGTVEAGLVDAVCKPAPPPAN